MCASMPRANSKYSTAASISEMVTPTSAKRANNALSLWDRWNLAKSRCMGKVPISPRETANRQMRKLREGSYG